MATRKHLPLCLGLLMSATAPATTTTPSTQLFDSVSDRFDPPAALLINLCAELESDSYARCRTTCEKQRKQTSYQVGFCGLASVCTCS